MDRARAKGLPTASFERSVRNAVDLAVRWTASAYERTIRSGGVQGNLRKHRRSQRLLILCRRFASVARQPPESELERLIEAGRLLLPAATDKRARALYLIARGFVPFWLRSSGTRLPTKREQDEAARSLAEGLALAKALDDPALISAGLDGRTMGPGREVAREAARRRLEMAQRLPVQERLDALGVVCWSSVLLGDLATAVEAADESVGLIESVQNPGFSLAGDSWRAYAFAMMGRLEEDAHLGAVIASGHDLTLGATGRLNAMLERFLAIIR